MTYSSKTQCDFQWDRNIRSESEDEGLVNDPDVVLR